MDKPFTFFTTVTSADQRAQFIARGISLGYSLARSDISSSIINGVPIKLKKYNNPIQVIPATI